MDSPSKSMVRKWCGVLSEVKIGCTYMLMSLVLESCGTVQYRVYISQCSEADKVCVIIMYNAHV